MNQSSIIKIDSTGTIGDEELSKTNPFSWFDGFKISILGLPDWVNYFYITFMAAIVIIALWYTVLGR